mmetsp:Transcript_25545/g.36642  ORF Transcript_25545/g.36642 Transcript_25545/m.36642 type:complete len:558 (-) Transcript_25545:1591-3264(-)
MSNQNHMECHISMDRNTLFRHGGAVIGSVDQGTSSTRYIVFNGKGELVASAQMEHTQIYPSGEGKVGWHEHDPIEIWRNVCHCINVVHETIAEASPQQETIKAIGITNQRETLIAWNAKTGMPYHNAIVWDDLRTTTTAQQIAKEAPSGNDKNRLRAKTGLPLASYFSGTKLRWLLENVSQLRKDLQSSTERENVRFGTIDTWLVYNLTGSALAVGHVANIGGIHVTDVSNASRWLLMDLYKCEWDTELIEIVCGSHKNPVVPFSSLPAIKSSSEVYGLCAVGCGIKALEQVPIASILGDQQAALFGQAAFNKGDAKCTYGTGCFLLMNTGYGAPVPSTNGLLSTVAFKLGDGQVCYALEGSVAFSGSVIQWLRDQLGIISSAPESETLAITVQSNDGLYFVPAFAGLFAPYWRDDARGCIVGMTASHTKAHIVRAALEASAYQTRDLFDAMYEDSGTKLSVLKVDGGGTKNNFLMQFQADMIDVPVVAPKVTETTAIGVAYCAGLAVGVWKSLVEIQSMWKMDKNWKPCMEKSERDKYWKGWKKAVTKSFDWTKDS